MVKKRNLIFIISILFLFVLVESCSTPRYVVSLRNKTNYTIYFSAKKCWNSFRIDEDSIIPNNDCSSPFIKELIILPNQNFELGATMLKKKDFNSKDARMKIKGMHLFYDSIEISTGDRSKILKLSYRVIMDKIEKEDNAFYIVIE